MACSTRVVANTDLVERLRSEKGWSLTELAARMHVTEPVVRTMLNGGPVGSRAQWGLFNAFAGRYSFTTLFRQEDYSTEEATA